MDGGYWVWAERKRERGKESDNLGTGTLLGGLGGIISD